VQKTIVILVDSLFEQYGEDDITLLSIREVATLVSQIEEQSGQEFIHMEMGGYRVCLLHK
jgi:hypothetical protein